MEEEFAYVEDAHCTDFSFSGPYLEVHSRHQPVALSVLCWCVSKSTARTIRSLYPRRKRKTQI